MHFCLATSASFTTIKIFLSHIISNPGCFFLFPAVFYPSITGKHLRLCTEHLVLRLTSELQILLAQCNSTTSVQPKTGSFLIVLFKGHSIVNTVRFKLTIAVAMKGAPTHLITLLAQQDYLKASLKRLILSYNGKQKLHN